MSLYSTLTAAVRNRLLGRRSFVAEELQPEFFQRVERGEAMQRNERWYETGGVVSEALDCYGLYAVQNGVTVNTESDRRREEMARVLDDADIELLVRDSIVRSLVYGDAYYEIAGTGRALKFYPMPPATVEHVVEDGEIVGYRQRADLGSRVATFDEDEVLHIQLIPSPRNTYGIALLSRARDEIERDVRTADSIATSMKRHGYPKWLVNIGQAGERIGDDVLKNVGRLFQDLKVNNELIMPADVKVAPIDNTGLPGIIDYNNIAIQRLCAALGVPEEVLGLGRGSTEATANVRLQTFFGKVSTFQRIWAREFNRKLEGRMGATITLNDVSPVDEELRSRVVKALTSVNPLDPFAVVSPEWCRGYMRLDDPDWSPAELLEVADDE